VFFSSSKPRTKTESAAIVEIAAKFVNLNHPMPQRAALAKLTTFRAKG
jgi:hypothetical protein